MVDDFKFVTEVFKRRCYGDQTMNLYIYNFISPSQHGSIAVKNLLHRFGKDSSRMHCIFNIFAYAGGLGIGDIRHVSEVYKGCFLAT